MDKPTPTLNVTLEMRQAAQDIVRIYRRHANSPDPQERVAGEVAYTDALKALRARTEEANPLFLPYDKQPPLEIKMLQEIYDRAANALLRSAATEVYGDSRVNVPSYYRVNDVLNFNAPRDSLPNPAPILHQAPQMRKAVEDVVRAHEKQAGAQTQEEKIAGITSYDEAFARLREQIEKANPLFLPYDGQKPKERAIILSMYYRAASQLIQVVAEDLSLDELQRRRLSQMNNASRAL